MPGRSRETLACLTGLDLPVHFIHGNGDRVVATFLAGGDISEVPEAFRDSIAWTAEQLDADQRKPLTTWPPMRELDIRGVGWRLPNIDPTILSLRNVSRCASSRRLPAAG